MPVVNQDKRNECIGVKITKDVFIVEEVSILMKSPIYLFHIQTENQMKQKEENDNSGEEILDVWWNSQMDSSNSRGIFQWFCTEMKSACSRFLLRKDVFERMREKKFDVAILEPISACGLGFVRALSIEKTILASSSTFYDVVLPYLGEPLDYSYVPSGYSISGDEMSMVEKFENWMVSREISIALEEMFDGEMEIYRKYLGEDIPNWKELFASASIFFVNSNPILDFPRPMLQKTVSVGGISVDMKSIRSQKLPEEWDEILNERPFNMLISFGTLVTSTHMPQNSKNGIIEVIKSLPNVSFIWKYESDEHSFGDGVPNLHFTKWVPQTTLLNDNRLTAFLCHGGLGSIMELAHIGKPALVVPVFADQNRNARTLERHQGAIYLHKTQLENVPELKKSFESILFDGKYLSNAKKLAKILKNQPNKPKDSVIKYTEFVGEHGPFPQMDPYGRHLNFFHSSFFDILLLVAIGFFLIILLLIITYFKAKQYFISTKEKIN
uniref:UDP-glucuronosyltransferase n=1 Tax=Caenorhabditis tropicalis TaxID=1561998 RepID=A0A1I7T654_9PELO